MSDFPSDLSYTKEHEWTRIDGNVARVGITTFAVEALGDITQVDLPDVGDTVAKDEVFGTVDSVKTVSDLYAPFSGKVVAINESLADAPELVNDSPYDEGWILDIEIANASEKDALLDSNAYAAIVADAE